MKTCPLTDKPCSNTSCSWYDPDALACAITEIARRIRAISETTAT